MCVSPYLHRRQLAIHRYSCVLCSLTIERKNRALPQQYRVVYPYVIAGRLCPACSITMPRERGCCAMTGSTTTQAVRNLYGRVSLDVGSVTPENQNDASVLCWRTNAPDCLSVSLSETQSMQVLWLITRRSAKYGLHPAYMPIYYPWGLYALMVCSQINPRGLPPGDWSIYSPLKTVQVRTCHLDK